MGGGGGGNGGGDVGSGIDIGDGRGCLGFERVYGFTCRYDLGEVLAAGGADIDDCGFDCGCCVGWDVWCRVVGGATSWGPIGVWCIVINCGMWREDGWVDRTLGKN